MALKWPKGVTHDLYQYYKGEMKLRSEAIKMRQVDYENSQIARLQDRLSRAKSPLKRQRFILRIQNAEARLLALKLAEQ